MAQPIPWKNLVADSIQELGGEASLKDITAKLKDNPDRPNTPTWTATVRRVVRQYNVFQPFINAQGLASYRLVQIPKIPPAELTQDEDQHGNQQGMLLQLGALCGYETFTNSTDKTIRKFKGDPLAKYATISNNAESLKTLPLGKMRTADVMWMAEDSEGLYPKYAFEVEHSTKVKNGLLRLLRIPDRFRTELYVIAPGAEEELLFKRYLKDSPFRQHAHRFHFFDYSTVKGFYESGVAFDKNVRNWKIQIAA